MTTINRLRVFILFAGCCVAPVSSFTNPALAGASKNNVDATPALQKLQSSDPKEHRQGAKELTDLIVNHHVTDLRRDPSIVPSLIQQLGSETDDSVRPRLIQALGELRDSAAAPVLEQVIRTSKHRPSRHMAMKALAQVEGSRAIPLLKDVMEKNPDLMTRFRAAERLGELGDRSGFALALKNVQSDSASVQREAAKVLGAIGDSQAIPVLENKAQASTNAKGAMEMAVKDIQLRQLGTSGEKLLALKKALYSGPAGVYWAAQKLYFMKSKEAGQILLDAARLKNMSYMSNNYRAQEEAHRTLIYLYSDNTESGYANINSMMESGIALDPPE